MSQQHISQSPAVLREQFLPRRLPRERVGIHLGEHGFGDAVEERLLVLEMTVRGHWINAYDSAKTAHRELAQSLGIDECERGRGEVFAVERRASGRGRHGW